MMGACRHRILRPVAALSATKLLLQKQFPEQLPPPVANACRALARQILAVMEIGVQAEEGRAMDVFEAEAESACTEGIAIGADHPDTALPLGLLRPR